MKIKVTKMTPYTSEKNPNLKAFANIVVGDDVEIYGIMLKVSKNGEYYAQMPTYIGNDGNYKSYVEPLSSEFAQAICDEIVKCYDATKMGIEYIPTESNDGNDMRYNFRLKEGRNGNYYGEMRINDELLVHNISIRESYNADTKESEKFVSMPSRQDDNGRWWSVVRPISDEAKSSINKYGVSAIGKVVEEILGNCKYSDMIAGNNKTTEFTYQNKVYARKIGDMLSEKGIRWSGKVTTTGATITINAKDNDVYTDIVSDIAASSANTKNQENTEHTEAEDDAYPF